MKTFNDYDAFSELFAHRAYHPEGCTMVLDGEGVKNLCYYKEVESDDALTYLNQLENRENFPEQTENLLLYRNWKNLRYEEVKSNIFCFCVAIIFSCMVAIVCDAGWLFAAICIPSSLIAIASRPKKILQRHECELPLVTVSESGIEVNREIIPKITVFIPWENLSEIKVFSFFWQTYIGFVPHDFEYLVETNKSAESFLRAFNGGNQSACFTIPEKYSSVPAEVLVELILSRKPFHVESKPPV